ncbi:MAG TPA: RDD family protein [Chloroflexota bacterium]|nr:RDD family protein [Chloroflexota bacterium]
MYDLTMAPSAPVVLQRGSWQDRDLPFPGADLPPLCEEYSYGREELAPYAAHFSHRFLALLVDLTTGGVALSLIFVLIGILQLALALSNAATGALALIALFAWWPIYYIGFWAAGGRTLGYRVAGLQLVKSDGTLPDFGTSVVRFLGACCSLAPFSLGYLWMLWDTDRQTWHDKMAGTMVVRE